MKQIGIALLVLFGLLGCGNKTVERFEQMNSTRITPQVDPKPASFIETLRMSCLEYGKFILEYQGEKEEYSCERI
jgi:uncharacterized lipoprotein NlpE involved in copper resistance